MVQQLRALLALERPVAGRERELKLKLGLGSPILGFRLLDAVPCLLSVMELMMMSLRRKSVDDVQYDDVGGIFSNAVGPFGWGLTVLGHDRSKMLRTTPRRMIIPALLYIQFLNI